MCMFCKSDKTHPVLTTHVVNYNGCTILVKNVPCEECDQCGEQYYSPEVAKRLEQIVSAAKAIVQEVSIIDYAAAA